MSDDTIDWLYGLQHLGIKLGLGSIRALLALAGNPQHAYRTIHVAGTNGKGSVAAMLAAMLPACGERCGLFTSPHLVRPHERIRIDGSDIDDGELRSRLATIRERIARAQSSGELEAHPSFFEVLTAAALEAFRDHRLDVAVLEVGLGGRLDATNAVDADVGVIVSIGFDHVKTLGDTLGKIAAEKAGIIKAGMPLISGIEQPEARAVVQDACRRMGAAFLDARECVRAAPGPGGVHTFIGRHGTYENLALGLAGAHQVDNARVAVAAFEAYMRRGGRVVDAQAVRHGLATVRWPARLQWIEPSARHPRMLVDGAHNPAGIARLAEFLAAHPLGDAAVLLFGATSGKPLDPLLEPLSPHCRTIVVARPSVPRGIDPGEVAVTARRYFGRVEPVEDTAAALSRASELAGPGGTILLAGSLYLVGDVLGLLERREVPGPVAL